MIIMSIPAVPVAIQSFAFSVLVLSPRQLIHLMHPHMIEISDNKIPITNSMPTKNPSMLARSCILFAVNTHSPITEILMEIINIARIFFITQVLLHQRECTSILLTICWSSYIKNLNLRKTASTYRKF